MSGPTPYYFHIHPSEATVWPDLIAFERRCAEKTFKENDFIVFEIPHNLHWQGAELIRVLTTLAELPSVTVKIKINLTNHKLAHHFQSILKRLISDAELMGKISSFLFMPEIDSSHPLYETLVEFENEVARTRRLARISRLNQTAPREVLPLENIRLMSIYKGDIRQFDFYRQRIVPLALAQERFQGLCDERYSAKTKRGRLLALIKTESPSLAIQLTKNKKYQTLWAKFDRDYYPVLFHAYYQFGALGVQRLMDVLFAFERLDTELFPVYLRTFVYETDPSYLMEDKRVVETITALSKLRGKAAQLWADLIQVRASNASPVHLVNVYSQFEELVALCYLHEIPLTLSSFPLNEFSNIAVLLEQLLVIVKESNAPKEQLALILANKGSLAEVIAWYQQGYRFVSAGMMNHSTSETDALTFFLKARYRLSLSFYRQWHGDVGMIPDEPLRGALDGFLHAMTNNPNVREKRADIEKEFNQLVGYCKIQQNGALIRSRIKRFYLVVMHHCSSPPCDQVMVLRCANLIAVSTLSEVALTRLFASFHLSRARPDGQIENPALEFDRVTPFVSNANMMTLHRCLTLLKSVSEAVAGSVLEFVEETQPDTAEMLIMGIGIIIKSAQHAPCHRMLSDTIALLRHELNEEDALFVLRAVSASDTPDATLNQFLFQCRREPLFLNRMVFALRNGVGERAFYFSAFLKHAEFFQVLTAEHAFLSKRIGDLIYVLSFSKRNEHEWAEFQKVFHHVFKSLNSKPNGQARLTRLVDTLIEFADAAGHAVPLSTVISSLRLFSLKAIPTIADFERYVPIIFTSASSTPLSESPKVSSYLDACAFSAAYQTHPVHPIYMSIIRRICASGSPAANKTLYEGCIQYCQRQKCFTEATLDSFFLLLRQPGSEILLDAKAAALLDKLVQLQASPEYHKMPERFAYLVQIILNQKPAILQSPICIRLVDALWAFDSLSLARLASLTNCLPPFNLKQCGNIVEPKLDVTKFLLNYETGEGIFSSGGVHQLSASVNDAEIDRCLAVLPHLKEDERRGVKEAYLCMMAFVSPTPCPIMVSGHGVFYARKFTREQMLAFNATSFEHAVHEERELSEGVSSRLSGDKMHAVKQLTIILLAFERATGKHLKDELVLVLLRSILFDVKQDLVKRLERDRYELALIMSVYLHFQNYVVDFAHGASDNTFFKSYDAFFRYLNVPVQFLDEGHAIPELEPDGIHIAPLNTLICAREALVERRHYRDLSDVRFDDSGDEASVTSAQAADQNREVSGLFRATLLVADDIATLRHKPLTPPRDTREEEWGSELTVTLRKFASLRQGALDHSDTVHYARNYLLAKLPSRFHEKIKRLSDERLHRELEAINSPTGVETDSTLKTPDRLLKEDTLLYPGIVWSACQSVQSKKGATIVRSEHLPLFASSHPTKSYLKQIDCHALRQHNRVEFETLLVSALNDELGSLIKTHHQLFPRCISISKTPQLVQLSPVQSTQLPSVANGILKAVELERVQSEVLDPLLLEIIKQLLSLAEKHRVSFFEIIQEMTASTAYSKVKRLPEELSQYYRRLVTFMVEFHHVFPSSLHRSISLHYKHVLASRFASDAFSPDELKKCVSAMQEIVHFHVSSAKPLLPFDALTGEEPGERDIPFDPNQSWGELCETASPKPDEDLNYNDMTLKSIVQHIERAIQAYATEKRYHAKSHRTVYRWLQHRISVVCAYENISAAERIRILLLELNHAKQDILLHDYEHNKTKLIKRNRVNSHLVDLIDDARGMLISLCSPKELMSLLPVELLDFRNLLKNLTLSMIDSKKNKPLLDELIDLINGLDSTLAQEGVGALYQDAQRNIALLRLSTRKVRQPKNEDAVFSTFPDYLKTSTLPVNSVSRVYETPMNNAERVALLKKSVLAITQIMERLQSYRKSLSLFDSVNLHYALDAVIDKYNMINSRFTLADVCSELYADVDFSLLRLSQSVAGLATQVLMDALPAAAVRATVAATTTVSSPASSLNMDASVLQFMGQCLAAGSEKIVYLNRVNRFLSQCPHLSEELRSQLAVIYRKVHCGNTQVHLESGDRLMLTFHCVADRRPIAFSFQFDYKTNAVIPRVPVTEHHDAESEASDDDEMSTRWQKPSYARYGHQHGRFFHPRALATSSHSGNDVASTHDTASTTSIRAEQGVRGRSFGR